MNDQDIKPDYSWLHTSSAPNSQLPKRDYRKFLFVAVAMLVIGISLALFFSQPDSDKGKNNNFAMSEADAVPAVVVSEEIIGFLAQGNLSAASELVSPLHDWDGSLADAVAAGYFGSNVDWGSCLTVVQPSHKTGVLRDGKDTYETVRTAHTCLKTNKSPVVIVFDLRRSQVKGEQWLLGQVVEVRDTSQ